MEILDIMSWVHEKELSLTQIEQYFFEYLEIEHEGYKATLVRPENMENDVFYAMKDLSNEDKRIGYLLRNDKIVAIVGYR